MDKIAILILGRFENLVISEMMDICPSLDILTNRKEALGYIDMQLLVPFLRLQHPASVTLTALYMKYVVDDVLVDVSDNMLEDIFILYPDILKQYLGFLDINQNTRLDVIAHYYKKLNIVPWDIDFIDSRPTYNLIKFYCEFFNKNEVFSRIDMQLALPSQYDTLEYAYEYVRICNEFGFNPIVNKSTPKILLRALDIY